MKPILAIDRSTDTQSVALVKDGRVVSKVFPHSDSRSADWPARVQKFLAANGIGLADLGKIVVGRGPGSFSGIRAALAFAQGVSAATGCEVTGLPSTLALSSSHGKIAVIGDARRERFWVVLHDGIATPRDFVLTDKLGLQGAVPEGYCVVTPDGARIEDLLKSVFAHRYHGSLVPLASRLAEVVLESPGIDTPEPLPIYLQAAVRQQP